MSVRKHNEYLDGNDSDDELDAGHHSDEAEEGRNAIAGRASKRRKREVDSDADGSDESEPNQDEGATKTNTDDELDRQLNGDNDAEETRESAAVVGESKETSVTSKHLVAAKRARDTARKSGVLYISRVPPFMKPTTLKHFLTPHCPKHGLGRIFLTPESHTSHASRVKRGGNKKKSYTDGWVEFVSKKEAKNAADLLNGQIMGGRKGGFYYDDLWVVRYLKGFKWGDLTEQIANEEAERGVRLREEVRRTRKENKSFLEDVERGKMMEGMVKKRKAKENSEGTEVDTGASLRRKGREFEQRKVKSKGAFEAGAKPDADLKRVLSKIF